MAHSGRQYLYSHGVRVNKESLSQFQPTSRQLLQSIDSSNPCGVHHYYWEIFTIGDVGASWLGEMITSKNTGREHSSEMPASSRLSRAIGFHSRATVQLGVPRTAYVVPS